jgi:hypothetical protein
MVEFDSQAPDASVYYCRDKGIDIQGKALSQIFGGLALLFELLYQILLPSKFIILNTILIRREAITGAGMFDQI